MSVAARVSRRRLALGALTGMLWGAAYAWPVAAVATRSVEGVGGRAGLTLDTVGEVLSDPRIGRLAMWSVAQCVASTAVVTVLGVPLGWVLGRLRFPGRRTVSAIVMTPFVLPTLTIAGAMLALTDGLPRSTAARFALIVGAHVTFNLGVMARSVAAAVAATPPEAEDAARLLGRSELRAVVATTIRSIAPTIGGAAIVVAVFCLTSFGVIVALGGASIGTIEVEVWYLTTRVLDLATAAVLVALQLLVVGLLLVAYRRVGRPGTVRSAHAPRPIRTTVERRLVVATSAVVAVVGGLPVAALVVRSFRSGGRWTVEHYRVLGGDGSSALGYSLAAGLVASVVALGLALPMVALGARDDRVGRWCERAMIVPLAMSAATMGLGYLLAFGGPLVDLRGTWVIVPLVQGASAAPVVARIVLTAVRGLDPSAGEAAAVLGAGPLRRLASVTWPALRRPVGVATGFAFAMSIGEFGATVFLSRAASPTVPVLIGRLFGRPGEANLGSALALSCVLGAVAALSVVAVDRAVGDGPAF